MPRIPSCKAEANERKYPYVIQLAAASTGLDFGLNFRIMYFHKTRHIQPRHGHCIYTGGTEAYFRWCFSDLTTARSFIEQFGGRIL
jgi:hypothetical protein